MAKLNISLDIGPKGNTPPDKKPGEPSVYYPVFHFEGPEELEDLGVPEKGTMTIQYEIVRETNSKNKDGTEWYQCDVEVRKIVGAQAEKSDAPTKSYKEAEDALDALAKAKSEENEKE